MSSRWGFMERVVDETHKHLEPEEETVKAWGDIVLWTHMKFEHGMGSKVSAWKPHHRDGLLGVHGKDHEAIAKREGVAT